MSDRAQPEPSSLRELGREGVAFRAASVQDAPALAAFAAYTFTETFGHLYPPEDLETFLRASYRVDAVAEELADAEVRCWLALVDEAIVGYVMWGSLEIAVETRAPAREIYRLYVDASVKGRGVAGTLMDTAIAEMRAGSVAEIWLSVWENNARAQAFYKRYGFEHMGEHKFMVGRVADRDFIWRLRL